MHYRGLDNIRHTGLRASIQSINKFIISFKQLVSLLRELLSLACPRESNQREGHPDALSLRDTLVVDLFHNGTRIDDILSSIRFRNIPVAQPGNKPTPQQLIAL